VSSSSFRDQAFSIGTSCDFWNEAIGENRAAPVGPSQLPWPKGLLHDCRLPGWSAQRKKN